MKNLINATRHQTRLIILILVVTFCSAFFYSDYTKAVSTMPNLLDPSSNLTDNGYETIDISQEDLAAIGTTMQGAAYEFIESGDNEGSIKATSEKGIYGSSGIIFKKQSDTLFTAYVSPSKAMLSCSVEININSSVSSSGVKSYRISVPTSQPGCSSASVISAVKSQLNISATDTLVIITNLEADKDYNAPTESKKSCGSQVTGLGWILCPIVDGLTKLNDEIWKVASSLLTVNPLEQGDNNVYNAWKTIRDLANIAFVVVFLITIFSQVTSLGISNYGIKKLLPKLIVCAILVNVSYVLSQITVDIANIVGSSLYKTLDTVSDTVLPTWGGALGAILGSTAGVAIGAAIIFSPAVGGIGAAIWMLAPVAIIGTLGLLAAVLTLAFRQAAIPILVIMAPIAIVARLLPGTEGLFKKWLGLVKPMLLLYPLAALVFGGARFAAGAINDENNWFSQIIALVILALPLFSLPFLAKSSGAITNAVNGALGKFKDKANSPAKNWGKEKSDLSASAYGAGIAATGGRGIFRRNYQASTYRKMTRKKQTETNNKNMESNWGLTDEGVAAIGDSTSADIVSKDVQTRADTAWHNRDEAQNLMSVAKNNTLANEDIKNRVEKAVEEDVPVTLRMTAKISEDRLKNTKDAIAKDLKEAATEEALDIARDAQNASGVVDVTIPLRRQLVSAQRYGEIVASQGASADRIIKQEYLNKLAEGGQFANNAAGIDPNGAARAQAGAVAAADKVWEEDVAASAALLKFENYDKPEQLNIITTGRLRDGSTATEEQKHAALKNIVETGHLPSVNKAINYALANPADPSLPPEKQKANRDFQKSLAEYVGKSSNKEKIIRGSNISEMATGNYGMVPKVDPSTGVTTYSMPVTPRTVEDYAIDTIIQKNPSVEGYGSMDQDELELWAKAVTTTDGIKRLKAAPDKLNVALANAEAVLSDTIIGPKLTTPQRFFLDQYIANLKTIK